MYPIKKEMDNKMDNKFYCEKCGASYKHRSGLSKHMKKCNGEKPTRGRKKKNEEIKVNKKEEEEMITISKNDLEYILNKLKYLEKELEILKSTKVSPSTKTEEEIKELDNIEIVIEEDEPKDEEIKKDKLDISSPKKKIKKKDNKKDKLDMDNKKDKLDIIQQKKELIGNAGLSSIHIEKATEKLQYEIRKNKLNKMDIVQNLKNLTNYNLCLIDSDRLLELVFKQYDNEYFYVKSKSNFSFYKMDNGKGYLDNRAINITSDIQKVLMNIYTNNIKQLYKQVSPYDMDFNPKIVESENDIIQCMLNLNDITNSEKLINTIQFIIQINNTKKDNKICDIKKDNKLLQEEYTHFVSENYNNLLCDVFPNFIKVKNKIISFLNEI